MRVFGDIYRHCEVSFVCSTQSQFEEMFYPQEILDGSCLLPELCGLPASTSCPQGYTICNHSNSTSCCKNQCQFCFQNCSFEGEFKDTVSNCLNTNQNISSCFGLYLDQKGWNNPGKCNQVQDGMEEWKNQTKYSDKDLETILQFSNDTRRDLCPAQSSGQCCPKNGINIDLVGRNMNVWPCGVWRSAVLKEPTNFWNFYYYSKFCCCGQGQNGTFATVSTGTPWFTNTTVSSTITTNGTINFSNGTTGTTNSTPWFTYTTISSTITTNGTINFSNGTTTVTTNGTTWFTNTTISSTITTNGTINFSNGTTSMFSTTTRTTYSTITSTIGLTNTTINNTNNQVNGNPQEDILPEYLKSSSSLSYELTLQLSALNGDPSWEICSEDGSKPFEDWLHLAHYSQSQLVQMTSSIFPVITDTQYICTVSSDEELSECFYVPNCHDNDDFYIPENLYHPCHIWARATDEYSYLYYDKFCREMEEDGILENDESEEIRCLPDTIFNLESGLCESLEGDEDDYILADTDYIHCPAGEVYCLEQDICAADCSGEDENEELDSNCLPGTEFCEPLGRCTTHCNYKRSLWIDTDEADTEDTEDRCSGNRVYCPAIHACSETCDFIHKKHMMDICKDGYVSKITYPNTYPSNTFLCRCQVLKEDVCLCKETTTTRS